MWQLMRLALLSVGLGAGLYALWQGRALLAGALYPSAAGKGPLGRWRLPRAAAPYRFLSAPALPKLFRHLGDLFGALFVSIVFSVFFYATNDGIPRLFAFLGCAFGAWLWKKTLGRPFFSLLSFLGELVRYLTLFLLMPPLSVLFGIGRRFLSCLIKAGGALIKKQKRSYTKSTSRRYVRRAVAELSVRRLGRRREAALSQEETGEGDV
ncbi:MAG: spore cortex biosynthesis protein YabQ [Clostridia bacterium]|nr:spore cortex biosynthesis protein YabQ [Clostridia bacterium]